MTRDGDHKGLEVHYFVNEKQWTDWIRRFHDREEGIWIKFAKKNSEHRSISYEQAREGAIRFGWIDGLMNSISNDFYLRKFTPRRRNSNWSRINREIAEQLIRDGKMEPAGIRQVELAKQNGRWEAAYDPQTDLRVPKDLAEQLKQNRRASRFFEQLSNGDKFVFLYRIANAKRPETREKHLAKTIEMLSNGQVYDRLTGKPVSK